MKILKNIGRVLSFVFRFCPVYIVASLFHIASSVILSLSKILIIKRAIDAVLINEGFIPLFNSLLIYLIVISITVFIRTIYNAYISPRYRAVFVKKMQNYMFAKVKYIDMESFDNPEFYEKCVTVEHWDTCLNTNADTVKIINGVEYPRCGKESLAKYKEKYPDKQNHRL